MKHPELIPFCYHAFVLIIGAFFAYLGFRLFVLRIRGNAGEIDTKWGKISKAAPGTMFVILGTSLIIYSFSRTTTITVSADNSYIIKTNADSAMSSDSILRANARAMFDSISGAETVHDSISKLK